jgi:uncharacterized protein (DUF302 family)
MPPTSPGVAHAPSPSSLQATAGAVVALLDSNKAISIMASVDHAANASGAGLTLPPTQVLLFGNPNLGTPVMQAAQSAGIDLPQKMLVYEDGAGDVYVAHNTTAYLVQRHGVTGVPTLQTIAGVLENFATQASGGTVTANEAGGTGLREGLVTAASDADVPTIYSRCLSALNGNDAAGGPERGHGPAAEDARVGGRGRADVGWLQRAGVPRRAVRA